MRIFQYQNIIAIGILLASFSGCSNETVVPQQLPIEVVVSIDNGVNTRTTLEGDKFIAGDKFNFFFKHDRPQSSGENTYTASEITTNGTTAIKWTPTTPIYWDEQSINTFNFAAVMAGKDGYSFTANGSGTDTYEVAADQSVEDGTAKDAAAYLKSDILMARGIAQNRMAEVKFNHINAKVVVNITASTTAANGTFTADELKNATLTLTGVCLKGQIAYDTSNSDVTATMESGEAQSEVITLYPGNGFTKGSDNAIKATYICVLPDQDITDITNNNLPLELKLSDGRIYKFKTTSNTIIDGGLTSANFLRQGKQTVINLTLKKTGLELKDNGGTSDSAITVEAWGDYKSGTADGEITVPQN